MPAILDRPQPAITHKDLMLATPGKLASWKGWIYELKYDGFRCLLSKRRDFVRLESRSGRDMSECFPELVDEIRPIRQDFIADAELIVLDERGRPVWERLKARHVIRKPERIRQAAAADPAALFAFDLLWLNGADFRPRTLFPPNVIDYSRVYEILKSSPQKYHQSALRRSAPLPRSPTHRSACRGMSFHPD